jgi:hypothetical protein
LWEASSPFQQRIDPTRKSGVTGGLPLRQPLRSGPRRKCVKIVDRSSWPGRAGIRQRRAGTDLDADFFNPARALTARDAAPRFADSEASARAAREPARHRFARSAWRRACARQRFRRAPTVIRSSVGRRRRSRDGVARVRAAVYAPAVCRNCRNMRPHISRSTHIVAPSSMT